MSENQQHKQFDEYFFITSSAIGSIIGIIVSSILLTKSRKLRKPLIFASVGSLFAILLLILIILLLTSSLLSHFFLFLLVCNIVVGTISIVCFTTSLLMIPSDTMNDKSLIMTIRILLSIGLVFASYHLLAMLKLTGHFFIYKSAHDPTVRDGSEPP